MGFIPLPLAVLVRAASPLLSGHPSAGKRVRRAPAAVFVYLFLLFPQLIRVVMTSVKVQGALSYTCVFLCYLG